MIGAWGNVLQFEVSEQRLLTPQEVKISGASPRYVHHAVLGAKPQREFTGPELATCSLHLPVSALLGVSPRALIDALRAARDAGEAHALVMGGKNVFPAGSLAVIESCEEDWEHFTPSGALLQAGVHLTFGEFVPPPQPAPTKRTGNTVPKSNTKKATR